VIISWNWLNRYCDLRDLDPVKAAQRFTMTTAEIEEVKAPPSPEFLRQFLVAEVRSVLPHPNADKLRCCKVFDGTQELSIVCGAANVREGLFTILAPIGCQLGDFTIKKAKLRGELSEGMLCSEKEIGIGAGDEGLVELSSEGLKAGLSIDKLYTELSCQWDLDNKAITHRPDLWGHYGLARETSAVFKRALKTLDLADLSQGQGNDGFSVRIDQSELCRRYCGLSLGNVVVGPSPEWLQKLLSEAGHAPMNNVVDATNFVMLELGQPTHAFDASRLPSRSLAVSLSQAGEGFETLTGKTLELDNSALLIRSGDVAVALAGVMGGANSSITDESTEIFLEAAHFAPLCVRRTAKRYDLRTDSSARFEKSLDPEHAPLAIRRLVSILKETCPQLVLRSQLIDVYPAPIPPRVILLNPKDVCRKMGVDIEVAEQMEILKRLEFGVKAVGELLEVRVPSFRNTKDVEESIDLVEEIGRIAGYDRIVPVSPKLNLESKPARPEHLRKQNLQDFLVASGYSEIKTYSFTSLPELEKWNLATDKAMALANPMSREQTHMRPGLLVRQMEAWQLNAKNLESFAMFEFGVAFEKSEQLLPVERYELLVSTYGESPDGRLFHRLKSDVLACLASVGIEGVTVVAGHEARPLAHPARLGLFMQGGREIGYISELHPLAAKKLNLKERISFAVIREPLVLAQKAPVKFKGLDRFPAVPFSLSLLVLPRTTVGELLNIIQNVDPVHIQDLAWAGNYSGASIPEGKVSMTITMNFRRSDRTMNGEEIQLLQDRIVATAAKKGYHLREA
jgi:phenylalanyl-tRNA synthetase beta chain